MNDLEKVKKGLRCHSEPKFGPEECFCETCPYDDATCGLDVPDDALKLLNAQDEVIQALIKVGYPHNFQREEPWIVNYMYAITEVIRKAVNMNNGLHREGNC